MVNLANDYFNVFKASIARIYHANGAVVGAGFLVSNQYVLTCAHVVAIALGIPANTQETPPGDIYLDFPLIAPGERLKAQVAFWKPISPTKELEDLAGLKVKSQLPSEAKPVSLMGADDVWGHPFRLFGFPSGHNDGVWATGVLRDKTGKGWVLIEDIKATGFQVEPGFSGAPVWDEQLPGVVGMTVAAERRRENVKAAFMIPTSILSSAWSELGQWMADNQRSLATASDSLPSFRQVKLKAKKDYLAVLCAKYEKAYNQLSSTLNESDKPSIETQIKQLENEIQKVSNEIELLKYG